MGFICLVLGTKSHVSFCLGARIYSSMACLHSLCFEASSYVLSSFISSTKATLTYLGFGLCILMDLLNISVWSCSSHSSSPGWLVLSFFRDSWCTLICHGLLALGLTEELLSLSLNWWFSVSYYSCNFSCNFSSISWESSKITFYDDHYDE